MNNIKIAQFLVGRVNKLNLYGQDLKGNVYIYSGKKLTNQEQMRKLYFSILNSTIAYSKSPTGFVAHADSAYWTKVR